MQMQDALDFRDGLWQVERTVQAGDDEFGVRAVEVRALISDNAIGAIRRRRLSRTSLGVSKAVKYAGAQVPSCREAGATCNW
jgi:hypothetical protein